MINLIIKLWRWMFATKVLAAAGVLQPNEYDASYFDGRHQVMKHNAGYYEFWWRYYRTVGENSLGEYWADLAKEFINRYNLDGKKVLEVGCAMGPLVQRLREQGVDTYGIDISDYAISEGIFRAANPDHPKYAEYSKRSQGETAFDLAPYLLVKDARTHLQTYRDNEFDFVFSLRFFECLNDTELTAMIPELNRIATQQFHRFGKEENEKFYTNRTESDLIDKGFQKGTDLATTIEHRFTKV